MNIPLEEAVHDISHAQMLIVGGTSLNVYPAAGLLHYFRGKYLVLINKSATSMDKKADLVIAEISAKYSGKWCWQKADKIRVFEKREKKSEKNEKRY